MKNTIKNVVISISFITFLFLTLLFNILKKDEEISIEERRKLYQFPLVSTESILDKTFFDNFDKYTKDQFIKRNEFRYLKVLLDLKIRNNYHNLYLKDDYIIEQIYPLDIYSINNITNKITSIKDKYLVNNNIYFSIIPDKNYFINDNNLKIDYDILEKELKSRLSFAKYISIFDELSLDNYYKTDSHWKEEDLLKVKDKLLKGMNNYRVVEYKKETITTFKGVYAYQLPIKASYENINILTNSDITSSYVIHNATNKVTSIFDLDKLNSNDKYDIYLSGASPVLTVYNDNIDVDKELLVFRDSYASSLIPLFVPYYSKITLIDTRYISPSLLENYVNFKNKDVLFIYSVSLINNSGSLK